MVDKDKKVKVWSRGIGRVSYNIPEMRISREWPKPGDLQLVSVEELETLNYMPGGSKLLSRYLLIKDVEVCEFLGLPTDPEYFYDENDVRELLANGTEDQLLDCLEFAPKGVIDLIKKVAIETKLDSSKKRKIISNALNISMDAMIRLSEDMETPTEVESEPKGRRSEPVKAAAPASKFVIPEPRK